MNGIYGELKKQLSASEMNNLKIKQCQWIKDRDAASQKELKEDGEGTLAYAEEARILHEMTRERCCELATYYMK
ncbi:lysozyme inhibitor LprI family protein [Priestia megaterium]|uniref:lysozyme inhibitor LprI family protein n=1 Tax=Priestia megaterium TaxID=1404 RepID=UPI0021F4AE72|nr:lysozyme inhibitor LprI family protein [Priestia megaterium]UYP09506.1 lysozyme inhibitor LprI family protein [Priestia megaterium]